MERKLRHRRKRGIWFGAFFLTAVMFLMMPFGQAFALVIDNFNGDQNFFITSGDKSDTYTGSGIIGGSRTANLHYISGTNKLSASTVASGSGFNVFSFSEDSGVNGICQIIWNANTPYDLTDGGSQNAFLFRWIVNDHPLNVTFKVISGASSAQHVFALAASTPQQNVKVPYSDFAGVDMTNVTRIELNIPEGLAGIGNENDFSVGPISTLGVAVTCNKVFDKSNVDNGDVVTATVTLTATGDAGGQKIVDVIDSLDSGLIYEPAGTVNPPDIISADLRTLTWEDVVVNVGTPVTLKYNIKVNSIVSGQTLCNNVQVFATPEGTLLTQCEDCVVKPEEPVPTFGEWGLAILALVLFGTGALYLRRRNVS